jgi:hypothetical protein
MVKPFSAQLYVPNEQRIPVVKDHTNMVKFAAEDDTTYQTAVRYLTQWVDALDQASGS